LFATRCARFALAGAAALSVAACGSSNTPSQTSSPSTVVAAPTTSAAAPAGETQVRGLIASVSGNAVQATQQSGTVTIDFTASTKVTEVSAGVLSDVTAGSCVSVRSKDGGASAVAAAVRVSPAVNGNCPQGKAPAGGKHAPIQGTVSAVAGNTITINTSGSGTPQTVTVGDKTKYTKEVTSTSQAIAVGKCITANGTEAGGALQATAISVRPAAKGKCPDGEKPGPHER